MLKLLVPQIGEESKNSKDLIFNILVGHSKLSLMQIYTKIKKEYNVSVSYQAIRKSVDSLVAQNVLVKNQRKYSLNMTWVLQLKSFFDNLAKSKTKGKKVRNFTANSLHEKYAVFKLESLFELDIFWGDVLLYLARGLKKGELRVSTNILHYTWWLLINLGRESKLYEEFKQLGIETYFICHKNAALNNKAKEIYTSIGHNFRFIEDARSSPCKAINTVGGTILEVEYPEKLISRIEKLYKKCKTLEDLPMNQVTKLVHEKQELKITVIRDELLAKNVRENFFRQFDN